MKLLHLSDLHLGKSLGDFDMIEDEENTILTMIKDGFSNRDSLKQEIANRIDTTVSIQKEMLINELTAYLCSC